MGCSQASVLYQGAGRTLLCLTRKPLSVPHGHARSAGSHGHAARRLVTKHELTLLTQDGPSPRRLAAHDRLMSWSYSLVGAATLLAVLLRGGLAGSGGLELALHAIGVRGGRGSACCILAAPDLKLQN